ncbi:unnamed protein product [Malus baccata var. baccata]
MEMEMEIEMQSYMKDSNVGVGVVVGGVETPTDTANHKLAARSIYGCAAKASWEINEINTAEKVIATRYYCHRCRHVVTVDVETSCPSCQGGFIQACEGVASLYLAMPSESELSESGSDGESTNGLCDSNPSGFVTLDINSCDVNNEVDEQRHEKRVLVDSFCQLATSSEQIVLYTSFAIESLSAFFDQVSSPGKPHYALIGMLLSIVAVLVCIWELVHNGKKERVVLRRRGMLWCFYHPPPNNKLFGSFAEITGLSLGIAQCICSAVQYHFIHRHAINPMKLSLLPFAYLFGLVVSKLVHNHRLTGLYNSNPSGFFTLGIDSRDENDEVDQQHDGIRATSSEWIMLLTSLVIEILSAVFDQASSPRKPHYALIGMLLAIVAVLVCIWELVHNGKKERIVLRRRGILWCFYYPPPNNTLFGTFAEITGLCLGTAQCMCSAVQYHFIRHHATNPMKLSPLAAVFFLGLVVSKLVQNQRFTVDDTLQNGYFIRVDHVLLFTNLGLEILLAAFDQVSSTRKLHYAIIGMLLAIVAVLACISELIHNGLVVLNLVKNRRYTADDNLQNGTAIQLQRKYSEWVMLIYYWLYYDALAEMSDSDPFS